MNADGRGSESREEPRMNADERGLESKEEGMGGFRVEMKPPASRLQGGQALLHKEVTDSVIGAFFEVYKELGPGFLESVYEAAMAIVLRTRGFKVVRQQYIPVYFRGELVGEFRADLFVEDVVAAELKAARAIDSGHQAQLLNYLKATSIEVGLLLNFGSKPEFKRLVFDNARKAARPELLSPPTSNSELSSEF